MSIYIFALGIKSANGLVKSTINTANALAESGVDVSIINILGKNGGLEFLDPGFYLNQNVSRYSLDALSIYFSNDANSNNLYFEISQKYLNADFFGRHKETLKVINAKLTANDMLIFTHPLALAIFNEAVEATQATTLLQVHGNYKNEIDNFEILKKYSEKVSYIQTVSSLMAKDLAVLVPSIQHKIRCIYNITHPLSTIIREDSSLKRISIIGSVQQRKNQIDAIRMLSKIPDRNVILQIFGNYLEKEYTLRLKNLIVQLNLTDRVFFKGVETEEYIYQNTDIAIMTSEHEGFGYIFLECSLYGIPIVAYDFEYGAREFTDNNFNGCLINNGDYENLANVVVELLSDQNKYNEVAKINKERFYSLYSQEAAINSYLSLFENINKNLDLLDVAKESASAADNEFRNVEMKKISLSTMPLWGQKDQDKVKELYYQISFDSDLSLNDSIFYYTFKKTKFKIDESLINVTDPEENEEFIPFKMEKFNSSEQSSKNIVINIPVNNRLSYSQEMRNFELFYSSGNQVYSVAKVEKEHVLTNFMVHETLELKAFRKKISEIKHIIRKDGFWIQYPSYEALKSIVNEDGELLSYESQSIRYDGEVIPFFKIKDGLYKEIKIVTNRNCVFTISFEEYDYKSVFDKLTRFEVENKLYDLQINGVYVWELMRAELFENFLEAAGVLDKHFTKKNSTDFNFFGSKNLTKKLPSAKKLLIEFPRKNNIDYRTQHLQDELCDNLVVLEYPQSTGYSDRSYDSSTNVYPIKDFLDYTNSQKVYDIQFSKVDKQKIAWLGRVFWSVFGLRLEFSKFVMARLKKFKDEFSFFNLLFEKNDFDEVLIPSAYWSSGIVAAARANGVISSDIQYALISKYHPSFSFPIAGRAYGSDRVYLWSKYWNVKEAPYNKSFVTTNNYFTNQLKNVPVDKVAFDVAFISQGRIGRKIFDFACSFAQENKSFKIVYCCHPDEDFIDYKHLLKKNSVNNISLNFPEQSTLSAISLSSNIVGVYSTSLFEALALKKNVFCLALNGYSVLEREISKGYIKLIRETSELKSKMSVEQNEKHDYMKLFYNAN